jgi:hypothetical protein
MSVKDHGSLDFHKVLVLAQESSSMVPQAYRLGHATHLLSARAYNVHEPLLR